jgi:hypothetical protein
LKTHRLKARHLRAHQTMPRQTAVSQMTLRRVMETKPREWLYFPVLLHRPSLTFDSQAQAGQKCRCRSSNHHLCRLHSK